MCTYSVLFHHGNLGSVYEWLVDSDPSDRLDPVPEPEFPVSLRWKKARGTLGYMLCHGLNKQIDAEPVAGLCCQKPSALWNIRLSNALYPLADAKLPYFFVSHSGRDTAVTVDLVDLVENVSGQDVLLSTTGRANKDACTGAVAVIILLSPAYLASRVSLLELGAALEARLGPGVPLLAVTANVQVRECIMRSCDNWAALRDEWRVAEDTMELVRRRIEDGTMLLWKEWEDGGGVPTGAKLEAAKAMVMDGSKKTSRTLAQNPPRFEVRDVVGGRVALEERQ
jgi:hypothetical protein